MASTAQGKDNLGCVTLPRLGVSTVEEQRDQTAQLHDGFTKSFCVQNLGFFFSTSVCSGQRGCSLVAGRSQAGNAQAHTTFFIVSNYTLMVIVHGGI